MYKSNVGRQKRAVEMSKGHYTEVELERRERLLDQAAAVRDAANKRQKEMGAWLAWANEDKEVARAI